MAKKKEKSRIFSVIGNIVYAILVIIVILILAIVLLQRFSNNTMALGGFRIFKIATESMVPVYNVGDIILDKEVPVSDLKKGDDITYLGKEGTFQGRVVTHRINTIEKQEDGSYKIVTQGVANSIEDPEITDSDVQGKVIYKFVVLSFISKMVNSSLRSTYLFILIPVALIIFINIRKLYLDVTESKEEENDKESDKEKDVKDEKDN